MIRARFKANEDDSRPVNWPVKHPYWCTGYGEGHSIIVAYADNTDEILRNWPEAADIEMSEAKEYGLMSEKSKLCGGYQLSKLLPLLVGLVVAILAIITLYQWLNGLTAQEFGAVLQPHVIIAPLVGGGTLGHAAYLVTSWAVSKR